MNYLDIALMPTSLEREKVMAELGDGCKGFHESVLRSYHILAKVKYLLEAGVAPEVILELVNLMENSIPLMMKSLKVVGSE